MDVQQAALEFEGGVGASKDEQKIWRDLSPVMRMLLLSDGSLTRHLELLQGSERIGKPAVNVDCFQMAEIDNEQAHAVPPEAAALDGSLLQRQVILGPPGKMFSYFCIL